MIGTERHTGRSVSGGRYIPMGSANLSPLISRLRDSFPPRGSLLQESFRTTQQGDEREQYCPPSSVVFGVKLLAVFFPLEGEGYGA